VTGAPEHVGAQRANAALVVDHEDTAHFGILV
jgi:hypothetical protein